MPRTIKTREAGTAAYGATCNLEAYVSKEELRYDTPLGTTVLFRNSDGTVARQGFVVFRSNGIRERSFINPRTGEARWVVAVEITYDSMIHNGNDADRGMTHYVNVPAMEDAVDWGGSVTDEDEPFNHIWTTLLTSQIA